MPLPLSEVHGLCCGLLCAMSSSAAKTRWFTELLDAAQLDPDAVASKAVQLKTLDEWFMATLSALNDADLEFAPELPEESAPVSVRIRALGEFCGGFNYGLGIALSKRGEKPLPSDTREIIEDFQAIESAETESSGADADREQQEVMYNEILEYVRVGVLLILEELRPITPVPQQVKPS